MKPGLMMSNNFLSNQLQFLPKRDEVRWRNATSDVTSDLVASFRVTGLCGRVTLVTKLLQLRHTFDICLQRNTTFGDERSLVMSVSDRRVLDRLVTVITSWILVAVLEEGWRGVGVRHDALL